MSPIITQFWNGILQSASITDEKKQIKELEELMNRNAEKLKAKVNEETQEIFSRYCDCAEEYDTLRNEQAFCDGFSLGVRIIAEAMIWSK